MIIHNPRIIWSLLALMLVGVFYFLCVWDYRSNEPQQAYEKVIIPIQKEQAKVIQHNEQTNRVKADTIRTIIDDLSVKTTILLDSLNFLKNENTVLLQELDKAQNSGPEEIGYYDAGATAEKVQLIDSIVFLRAQIDSQAILCGTRDSVNTQLSNAFTKILCERDSLQFIVTKLQQKHKRDKLGWKAAALATGALILKFIVK